MSLRYAVLGLLVHEPMTGYEIARLFDASVGHFWSARHQQIYRELREMAGWGWLGDTAEPHADRPDARRYAITESGLSALAAWVDTPLPPHRPREPVLLKLLAAPAVPPDSLMAEFDRQLADVEARLAAYRDIVARHYDPPPPLATGPLNRHAVLYLSLTRGLSAALAYRDWLIETRDLLVGGAAT
ncbi:PadR family transcriptional regulator [Salinisphaera sp. Q1T1-3]|uniref:PadR family transcriptional regulator n=1 Tax=Salinisphaera sp. Q1T1-3 TaxID=2321229 RepID=UPI000E76149C|nr:PadR family transcriptional regulator [Salinisphaera sp. Q1T1-3]RJS93075.1 PadR family transcriptional regulator [Salinisphaera sp. Q1T1-3]